ncbi:MAG: radical SAM protein [Clostridia bacterium]|nr:radical SAM protein [Clostridia bacterium]
MKKKFFHIPIFVPHKGCPHDCVFCNQRKITGRQKDITTGEAKLIIDSHLETIEKYNEKGTYYAEIAFFGGSFTAIDINKQTKLLKIAQSYVNSGRVHGIRCSTRPDAIDDDILLNCKKYGVTAIELGVQSADEEVLSLSERGHSFKDVENASDLIKKYGIELGLQMMTGLPGDTFEKSIETANKIASLCPKNVRIYPTLVMEGTRLMEMYEKGEYEPQSLLYAVNLAAEVAQIFISKGIDILRISLQTTDGVNAKTVIGPYHEAFAELVYSEIEKRKLEKHIIENKLSNCTLEIKTDKPSQVIGHRRSNKEYFKEKYNIDIKLTKN